MLVHARSGDAAFAACLRIFRHYPLAVRRHYAEHRYGSMVLMNRDAGTARFYVLIMEWDDLFVLRHWDRRDGARVDESHCRFNGLLGDTEFACAEIARIAGYFTQNRRKIPVIT